MRVGEPFPLADIAAPRALDRRAAKRRATERDHGAASPPSCRPRSRASTRPSAAADRRRRASGGPAPVASAVDGPCDTRARDGNRPGSSHRRDGPASATASARRSTRPRRPPPPARRPIPSARSSTTRASSPTSSDSASRRSTRSTRSTTARRSSSAPTASARTCMERAEERGLDVIDGTCTWVIQEQRELDQARRGGLHDRPARHAAPSRGRRPARLRARRDRRRRGRGLGADPAPQEDGAHQRRAPSRPGSSRSWPRSWSRRSHELKIVNTVCPVTIRRQQDTLETAARGRPDGRRRRPLERQHQGADAAVRDRRHAGRSRSSAVDDLADAAPFDGAPDRRRHRRDLAPRSRTSSDVAERILELAGTPEARARADELAMAALAARRDPGRPDDLAAEPDRRRRLAGRRRRLSVAVAGLPVVAIVGRPNVGKSTLFNRILGQRTAIVEDRARTTRDRLYGDADWNGRRFVVVDTGGLEIDPDDPIEDKVQEQARLAIDEADVIVFVVDADRRGPTPADLEAAAAPAPGDGAGPRGRQQGRQREARARGAPSSTPWAGRRRYPISAAHGRGTGDLLDAIVWALPPETRGRARPQGARGRGRGVGRDVAAGRLVPDRRRRTRSAGDADRRRWTPRTPMPIGRRSRGGPLGRGDGRRRRRAGRDRDRRPAERRQVEPAQRAARRGAGDRQRHPGHDPRRDRHAPGVGPERGRPDRHGRHPAAGQGRRRAGRRALLDAARAEGDRRGPTWRSWSSTPSTA